MLSDGELLRRYVDEGSEEAFATLVQRHLNVVQRAALRRVGGNAHAADDVTQRVFTALARKARTLRDRASLAGWLYTGTRFAAAEVVRSEQRRRAHEQEAHLMQELNSPPPVAPHQLEPVLDEVVDALHPTDREAVLLHFFENRSFVDVGASLSLSADAARMRVNRALERLRAALAERGIASTAAALGTALATQSTAVAASLPAAQVAQVAVQQASLAAGGAAGTGYFLSALRSAKFWGGAAAAVGIGVGLAVVSHTSPSAPASNASATVMARGAAEPVAVETLVTAVADAAPPEPARTSAAVASGKLRATSEQTQTHATAFTDLVPAEKNILKNLWTNEQARPPLPGRRWAFAVRPTGINYAQFQTGCLLLETRGLVKVGLNGGVHLTPAGLAYCAEHGAAIEAYPPFYRPASTAAASSP